MLLSMQDSLQSLKSPKVWKSFSNEKLHLNFENKFEAEKVAASIIALFMKKVNRKTIIGPCFAFCSIISGLCGYFFYVEGNLLIPGRLVSFIAMLGISGQGCEYKK